MLLKNLTRRKRNRTSGQSFYKSKTKRFNATAKPANYSKSILFSLAASTLVVGITSISNNLVSCEEEVSHKETKNTSHKPIVNTESQVSRFFEERGAVAQCNVYTTELMVPKSDVIEALSLFIEKHTGEHLDYDIIVGISTDYWNAIAQDYGVSPLNNIKFHKRKIGKYGGIPNTGGDIYLQVRGKDKGNLFLVILDFAKALPDGCIRKLEDVYGFDYPDRETDTTYRKDVLPKIVVKHGDHENGSFLLNQNWVYQRVLFHKESYEFQKKVIDNTYIGTEYDEQFKMLRDWRAFGTFGGDHGLIVTNISDDTEKINRFCLHAVGKPNSVKGLPVQNTTCLRSQIYYLPTTTELQQLKQKHEPEITDD
eukprot:TRINITY_DN3510_c0_g1_i1.p1 TRINITY_DN3510_c0_g1~~TRINITY_DN3510_c0_g1_i1.p1  ORF type:complete len:367 (+),score=76.85 TRINITY_DN3510_c0_g1_i1:367-1467(+)